MKRIISLLLSIIMVFSLVPTTAFATGRTIKYEGDLGTNLHWTIYDDGDLMITGNGDMEQLDPFPYKAYRSEISKITICHGVTSIANRAFEWFENLTEVRIANSVKSIGLDAFFRCYIDNLYFTNGTKTIQYSAFNNGVTSISSVYYDGTSAELSNLGLSTPPASNYYYLSTINGVLPSDCHTLGIANITNPGAADVYTGDVLKVTVEPYSGYTLKNIIV